MPYMFVSTQINLDSGPTCVGDSDSDPELMRYLQAEKITELGKSYSSYRTKLMPRLVLDLLEEKGWKVVTCTGIGQTCLWTLHKSC